MKWLSYGWTVLINLITTGVVISLFGVPQDNFESLVIALLVLIYISIQTFSIVYGQVTMNATLVSANQFRKIRKIVQGDTLGTTYEAEAEEEEFKEAGEKVSRLMVKSYITSGFVTINYIIALWHVFSAIS